MKNLLNVFSRSTVAQNAPLPGTTQVENNAGGFVWELDDWQRLDRFLVLGSEGGTYYVSERKLTLDNVQSAVRCIKADGLRLVGRVVEISEAGRAPKNDAALFLLAAAAAYGDEAVRKAALAALPRVARTGTHLFSFIQYAQQMRGWGRAMRKAVAAWYAARPVEDVVYQTIKYRQRGGWTHRDALRLAHPKAGSLVENAVYHWVTQGWPQVGPEPHPDPVLRRLWAFETLQIAQDERAVVALLGEYNLPWEAVPSQWLASKVVWEALLPNLPLTALLRSLGRLTACGVLAPQSEAVDLVVDRLTDSRRLKAARIHPLALLVGLKTYAQGHGEKGSLKWNPVARVVDALDLAFYRSFGSLEASGKRVMLALDVSGSMGAASIAGTSLTAREAAAAMALITASVEKDYIVTIFSNAGAGFMPSQRNTYRSADGISTFDISPRERLDDVVRKTSDLPFGGTDCSLPMLYALRQGLLVDAFVIYTDSETWAGEIHPTKALEQYRQQTGIAAKLVVVGMTATAFSIADPNDGGMLDVVGFDPAAPPVITGFIKGE